MKAIEVKSKTNSFQEWIFGQAKWACLSYRSLEGGTRVQQIIIGYFCSPNFKKIQHFLCWSAMLTNLMLQAVGITKYISS